VAAEDRAHDFSENTHLFAPNEGKRSLALAALACRIPGRTGLPSRRKT
jgi:hypothetical protein